MDLDKGRTVSADDRGKLLCQGFAGHTIRDPNYLVRHGHDIDATQGAWQRAMWSTLLGNYGANDPQFLMLPYERFETNSSFRGTQCCSRFRIEQLHVWSRPLGGGRM